jgi:hypothetical protein
MRCSIVKDVTQQFTGIIIIPMRSVIAAIQEEQADKYYL